MNSVRLARATRSGSGVQSGVSSDILIPNEVRDLTGVPQIFAAESGATRARSLALLGMRILLPADPLTRLHDVGGLNCACCASSQDLWYSGSSMERAGLATLSGRKVSIMTASSSVYLAPMLASARPG